MVSTLASESRLVRVQDMAGNITHIGTAGEFNTEGNAAMD